MSFKDFFLFLWSSGSINSRYYDFDFIIMALVCGFELCSCYFPMWYPGSGVVLDCIDSRSCPLTYFHIMSEKSVFSIPHSCH